jgi:hypothetical protein
MDSSWNRRRERCISSPRGQEAHMKRATACRRGPYASSYNILIKREWLKCNKSEIAESADKYGGEESVA